MLQKGTARAPSPGLAYDWLSFLFIYSHGRVARSTVHIGQSMSFSKYTVRIFLYCKNHVYILNPKWFSHKVYYTYQGKSTIRRDKS